MADRIPTPQEASRLIRVWDPVVRLFHWSLVASFAIAWFTSEDVAALHHWAGYAAAALITLRLVWGLIGSRYARFAQFLRGPRATMDYLRDIAAGREQRHLGHNPAGAAMIVTLMAVMALTAVTGWMETTNRWFGVDWVQELHSLAAHGLLLLVLVHLGGVALASLRHRENLVRAMIRGAKRAPGPGDIA